MHILSSPARLPENDSFIPWDLGLSALPWEKRTRLLLSTTGHRHSSIRLQPQLLLLLYLITIIVPWELLSTVIHAPAWGGLHPYNTDGKIKARGYMKLAKGQPSRCKPASHTFWLQVGAWFQSSPCSCSGLCCRHPLLPSRTNPTKSDSKRFLTHLKDGIPSPWSRQTRKKKVFQSAFFDDHLPSLTPGACCRGVREGDSWQSPLCSCYASLSGLSSLPSMLLAF